MGMPFGSYLNRLKNIFKPSPAQPPQQTLPPVTDQTEQAIMEGKEFFFGSTNVNSARYFYDDRIAEVTFDNGRTYHYYGVPVATFRALVESQSPGRTIWNLFRNIFEDAEVFRGDRAKGTKSNTHKGKVVRSLNELLTEEEKARFREFPE